MSPAAACSHGTFDLSRRYPLTPSDAYGMRIKPSLDSRGDFEVCNVTSAVTVQQRLARFHQGQCGGAHQAGLGIHDRLRRHLFHGDAKTALRFEALAEITALHPWQKNGH